LELAGEAMSNMQNKLKKLKYDRRLTNFSIKTGEMTKEELEKHLASLEDCSDRAKNIKIGSNSEGQSVN
jgi:hypothetical protein